MVKTLALGLVAFGVAFAADDAYAFQAQRCEAGAPRNGEYRFFTSVIREAGVTTAIADASAGWSPRTVECVIDDIEVRRAVYVTDLNEANAGEKYRLEVVRPKTGKPYVRARSNNKVADNLDQIPIEQ